MKNVSRRCGLALVAVVSLLSGCGGTLAQQRVLWRHAVSASRPVRLQQIDANTRVLAAGFLKDRDVTWMLDSGASFDSVTPKVAHEHGLPIAGSDSLAKLADGELHGVQRAGQWPAGIFRGDQRPRDIIVLPGEELTRVGVAGIYGLFDVVSSDQGLALDLPARTLFALDGRFQAAQLERLRAAGAAVDMKPLFDGKAAVVSVVVDGKTLRMLVDTGAPITTVFADTDVGIEALESQSAVRYLVRENIDSAVVFRGHVALGSLRIDQPVGVWPRIFPDLDGVLGLDVLQGCVLIKRGELGALSCGRVPRGTPATLDVRKLQRVPMPRALGAPPVLPPGVLGKVGCTRVTAADLAAWIALRGAPAGDKDLGPALRALAVERAARALDVVVSPLEVEEAVKAVRRQVGMLDDEQWVATLAQQALDEKQYRQRVIDQLFEAKVVRRLAPDLWSSALSDEAKGKRSNDLVARLMARLAAVETAGKSCTETWPRYHLEHVRLEGLDVESTRVARLALGRVLDGRPLALDVVGRLPERIRDALSEIVVQRGFGARSRQTIAPIDCASRSRAPSSRRARYAGWPGSTGAVCFHASSAWTRSRQAHRFG